jgi:hypothetical protein
VIIAVLGCVVVLGAAIAGIARLRGWDPRSVAGARHALGEAGYRVSTLWAEFSDWLRLGSR